LPFASQPIRRAFERFGDVVFPDGSVLGGPDGASQTWFGEAQHPMFDDPPGCWLHLFPTFAETFWPVGASSTSTNTFPFPPLEGQTQSLIGGGEITGAFSDRPEVREVIRFLLSPDHGVEFAEQGLGLMSPHRDFELSHYRPNLRASAEALQDALAADTFRFDASDLMPRPISTEVFNEAMMTYVHEGPESLDEVLAELDAAWPDTG
jgi:alpha-glucoside transport system substrate-binding protein